MAKSPFRKWLEDERGRAVRLSEQLGVTPGAVTQWADKQVPAERMFQIARLTGIPVQDLRPDVVKA
jgi:DNA-binding transcriptional regulator YdaS (Cro superfamily)